MKIAGESEGITIHYAVGKIITSCKYIDYLVYVFPFSSVGGTGLLSGEERFGPVSGMAVPDGSTSPPGVFLDRVMPNLLIIIENIN